MKNSDITTTTRVRHPEGGDYVIQRQSMNGAGEVLSVAIGKNLHATAVFDGSPDEARKHGFLFGDEGDMRQIIDGLNAQVEEFSARVTQDAATIASLRARAGAADRALDRFKEQVRDAIIAAAKEHDLCKEGTNSVLSNLGLDKWSSTWTVTVTDSDGDTILTVRGIEADDADAAERKVRDNFSVSAEIKRVKFSYEYDGEGETDWDSEEYEDDDLSDDDDEYASNHMHDLSYSADEE
jgi:hypothetical protein